MIKKISILALITSLTIVSCDKKSKYPAVGEPADNQVEKKDSAVVNMAVAIDVPFTEAKNYFVKNTVKDDHFAEAKIATQADFDKLFGAATTMGKDGKPTAIDFSKQYVIAVTEKETNVNTTLVPVSLTKMGDVLKFKYEIKSGEKTTSTMKPLLLVVVDNQFEGKVEVENSEMK